MGKLFHYFQGEGCKITDASEKEKTIIVTLTDRTKDRYDEIMNPKGAILKNFIGKNAPHLWMHNMRDTLPPIGLYMWTKVIDDALRGKILFMDNEFSMSIHYMHTHPLDRKVKFLNGISIGFDPKSFREGDQLTEKEKKDGVERVHEEWELLEGSSVTVGANPNALSEAYKAGRIPESIYKSFNEISPDKDPFIQYKTFVEGIELEDETEEEETEEPEIKTVIGYKKHPLAPVGSAWDAGAEVKQAEVKDLKIMCTWYDTEHADLKTAYKLPHHKASGYATVWRGVAAAMGALLGARGGVMIPANDKKGVYSHLKKHYAEFDKEAPEFREYSIYELYQLSFIEGKIFGIAFTEEEIKEIVDTVKQQTINELMGKEESDKDKDEIDIDSIEFEEETQDKKPEGSGDKELDIPDEEAEELIKKIASALSDELDFAGEFRRSILGKVDD